jgi:hypothetical protein
MSTKVFVVYKYSDNRKENCADILAVCKNKQNAISIMNDAINKFAEEYESDEIEIFENGANVLWEGGSNCEVFLTDEMLLLQ